MCVCVCVCVCACLCVSVCVCVSVSVWVCVCVCVCLCVSLSLSLCVMIKSYICYKGSYSELKHEGNMNWSNQKSLQTSSVANVTFVGVCFDCVQMVKLLFPYILAFALHVICSCTESYRDTQTHWQTDTHTHTHTHTHTQIDRWISVR